MSAYRFLISGGGTGGHVYPAIAIADAIKSVSPESTILFAGTRSKMEWIAVPQAGYDIKEITISGIQRRFTLKNLLVPFKLILSILQSRKIIKEFKPDAVICTGGYVSGPVGWAAGRAGIPLFLQEQNSFPGITTRKLAPHASIIFTAFEAARNYLPVSKIILYGNPTRKELLSGSAEKGLKAFGFSKKHKTLLVLGGSGGAKAINDAIAANIKKLHDELGLQIVWQSGDRYLDTIKEVIDPLSFERLRLFSFVNNMTDAYAAADIVLSRAGASICSELLVTGKPSVLVPSPNVAGDHQSKNAEEMVAKGAAALISDKDLSSQLFSTLKELLDDKGKLETMSKTALEMAKPNAAEKISRKIFSVLENIRRAA